MKSLFTATDLQEIIGRIHRLSPIAKAGWGKMSVDQMLVHVQRPLKVGLNELKLKRTLVGILFGGLAKKRLTSDEPWKKNLPTDKNFVVREHYDVEAERKNLIALVQRFAQAGPGGITQEPHPFFGAMTGEEWGILMWKHLDHHLGQFGA